MTYQNTSTFRNKGSSIYLVPVCRKVIANYQILFEGHNFHHIIKYLQYFFNPLCFINDESFPHNVFVVKMKLKKFKMQQWTTLNRIWRWQEYDMEEMTDYLIEVHIFICLFNLAEALNNSNRDNNVWILAIFIFRKWYTIDFLQQSINGMHLDMYDLTTWSAYAKL